MGNPIDEALGIMPTQTEEEKDSEVYDLKIPEDATLDDVTKLALQAYREQIINLQHFDPKYRSRMLEVAAMYLNIAKESLTKNKELKQKQEKLDSELNNKSENEKGSKVSVSRKELYEKAKELH